jgi:hypothetical protein
MRAVTELLEAQGHKIMLLPPCSPDLDSLAYAVFGHTKAWQERAKPSTKVSLGERCAAFVKHLEAVDPQKQAIHYIDRLNMVLEEQGGRIEEKMRKRISRMSKK